MTVSSRLSLASCLLLLCRLSLIQALTDGEVKIIQDKGHMTITKESNGYYKVHGSGEILHETGSFPNADNPNDIVIKEFTYYIPPTPKVLDYPGCLPEGTVGITVIGTAIYNPFTGDGLNALLNEVLDQCHGHPSPNGKYHYHGLTACVPQTSTNELVGFAMDGYPIYGNKDENGQNLTSADLDACHGRTVNGQYRYHATEDFPYYLGCFKAYVDSRNKEEMSGMPQQGQNGTMMGSPQGDGGNRGPPPGDDGNRGPPPGDGGNRQPPGSGMDDKCYYANVSNPTGVNELTAGTFNNGITINPPDDDTNNDPSTASLIHSNMALSFGSLFFSIYRQF